MGTGMDHAFHKHDNSICLALDEQHIHQKKTECYQLHFFILTLNYSIVEKSPTVSVYCSTIDQGTYTYLFIINLDETDPERGPPSFNMS